MQVQTDVIWHWIGVRSLTGVAVSASDEPSLYTVTSEVVPSGGAAIAPTPWAAAERSPVTHSHKSFEFMQFWVGFNRCVKQGTCSWATLMWWYDAALCNRTPVSR